MGVQQLLQPLIGGETISGHGGAVAPTSQSCADLAEQPRRPAKVRAHATVTQVLATSPPTTVKDAQRPTPKHLAPVHQLTHSPARPHVGFIDGPPALPLAL